MFSALIAQAAADGMLSYIVIGVVVVGLSSVLQLALSAKQLFGGNKGERQIEPTQLAGIAAEMKSQTATLTKLDREMGETRTAVGGVKDEIVTLRAEQREEGEKMWRRINAISTESTETKTRVGALERENERN